MLKASVLTIRSAFRKMQQCVVAVVHDALRMCLYFFMQTTTFS